MAPLASELRVTRDIVARLRLRSVLRFSVRKRFAGLRPEGTMRIVVFRKAGAKVLLFFDMTKFFCIFFA